MDYEVASMDDHSIFGEVLYQLHFSEAIKKDLLSDYQVVVIGVDDAMIKQKIVNRELIKVDNETILDAETIASQIAITKAIKDYDLNRIITFHSKIKNAKNFSTTFAQVLEHIEDSELSSEIIICEHISGAMKTSERNQKLYELKNLKSNERRIISNARCLSEGVDVPTLSGIAFINPKQSQIDIIQAVGRAIRKSDDKSKGTIVIPLYISEEESLDEAILLSNFNKVWQIVIALKSQDDSLMECIDKLRIQKGREGKITFGENLLDKFIFDIPQKLTSRFSNSIQTLLVENTSENWFENFGRLKRFYEIEGHSTPKQKEPIIGIWCNTQRVNYKTNCLSKDKINHLENLGFMWDVEEGRWMQKFHKLKKIYEIEGHSYVPHRHPELGHWSSEQRASYKYLEHRIGVRNKMPQHRIDLLNTINFDWDLKYPDWNDSFNNLKKIFETHGINGLKDADPKLKRWIFNQRSFYKSNKLSEERINKLNNLDGWSWGERQKKGGS